MNEIKEINIETVTEEFNQERFKKSKKVNSYYRELTRNEIDILEMQKNRCYDWSKVLVTDSFQPNQIKLCNFSGLVRIDDMEPVSLVHHDLVLPTGLYNSHIASCDIGKKCSIHNVSYMSRFILGENVILKDVNELVTSDRTKFGNGIVRKGEDPKVRIEMEIANEAGGREILPFDKLLTPDAYLWYKYRSNKELMDKFRSFVDKEYGDTRGEYGYIGDRTIIKNTRIIKDVTIGTDAYIKGCNKLKNLTIKSNEQGKTQIGEGCELVNGIIGEGCRIFYGVMAVRFQLLPYSALKYGARLINSVLGENSTISCCEVLNSFIFPGHEQHHNSSFLIATLLMGQTNIASGATIGSNHNSRKNDGELVAGRGFWPGLNCSLKHNSKFATYNILVKGSYPAEINCPLPFSLISLNSEGNVQVFPGYWFLYNMYALRRNSWKYKARDKRQENFPNLEFNFLAPDTVIEMVQGMRFLEKAALYSYKKITRDMDDDITGEDLLVNYEDFGSFSVFTNKIENKNPNVKIHKPEIAYNEYKKMINLFIVENIMEHIGSGGNFNDRDDSNYMAWKNCGGQLIPEFRVESLIHGITNGAINSWDEIHNCYKDFTGSYLRDKFNLALSLVRGIYFIKEIDEALWSNLVNEAIETRIEIRDRVYDSRIKDYHSKFRSMVYDTKDEMKAVLGAPEDDPFFAIEEEKTKEFVKRAKEFKLLKEN